MDALLTIVVVALTSLWGYAAYLSADDFNRMRLEANKELAAIYFLRGMLVAALPVFVVMAIRAIGG